MTGIAVKETGAENQGGCMRIELRPYQVAAVRATLGAIDQGQRAGLWAMPTGCGKTVTFTALAGQLRRRTLVLVHRDELVRQTVATVKKMFPAAPVGVIKAERNEWNRTSDGQVPSVVVASVQSLHARRLKEIPRDRFGLVIADEAHHAAAPTWGAILDHFGPHAFTLGVSATPFRTDGKSLERFGREPLYTYGLRQAIKDKWLVRLRQYAVETRTTLDGVAWRAGDFADGELSRTVNTPERNRIITDAYQKRTAGCRAIAFTADVQHAIDLAEAFQAARVPSAAVSGVMPLEERRAILGRFAAGEIRVLSNCQVLGEGFDDPGIESVIMARPTGSRGFYQQAIGRGLRLAPGKEACIVLDFVDASRHKLVNTLDLLGATEAVDAQGRDVLEVVDEDRQRAEAEARIASQRPLRWRVRAVSPWPDVPDLRGYTERMPWESASATDKQLRYLKSFGLEIGRNLTKGEACYLINRALEYDAAYPTPATSKQRWRLQQEGLWKNGLSKREATQLLAQFFSRC